ncbi:FAD-binding protein [Micrococcales bacterium 31B]|nr:FAD-binding protein [Micrococcales bacterium 31B]
MRPSTDPREAGQRAATLLARHPASNPTEAARREVATDRSGYVPATLPSGVIHARSSEDVQLALRLATELGVAIVPRGAGTGLAGGASAQAGEVVLDVSRMNRIVALDPAEQTLVVEPGVLNAEINRHVREHGLFYAPDPASTEICSIGGNIATNAGGMCCAKYGVTRESVLALAVVLPNGELVRTGPSTLKKVTGYDMNALFTGSEGTLGVVVEATLRLRPLPARVSALAGYFESVERAAAAAAAVIAARVQPSVMELMDAVALDCIDAAEGSDLARRGSAMLLAQTDGWGAAAEMEVLAAAVRPFAAHLEVTEDADEADALLSMRRGAIPAMGERGTVAICDVGVPRTRLAEMVTGIAAIARDRGVTIGTLAHASDGNLHPCIILSDDQDIVSGAVKEALGDMFHQAHSLGGTLTGEHGVGLLKLEWVPEELDAESIRLQRGIRELFDPQGVLNPGKVF